MMRVQKKESVRAVLVGHRWWRDDMGMRIVLAAGW